MTKHLSAMYSSEEDFPVRLGGPDQYVMIASIPRSGSTHLCTELWRTGCIGSPLEYFNFLNRQHDMLPRLGDGDYRAYWDTLKTVRTSPNGVFSYKVFPQDFQQIAERCDWLGGEIRADHVIYLTRRDKLAQAVSYSKAHQTSAWFSGVPFKKEPLYSRAGIDTALEWINNLETRWESLFKVKKCKPLRVYYEDLESNIDTTVNSILDFCEISPTGIEKLDVAYTERQRDAKSKDWISLYSRGA